MASGNKIEYGGNNTRARFESKISNRPKAGKRSVEIFLANLLSSAPELPLSFQQLAQGSSTS
eukprot:7812871-Pyramimonas_sp.AAC.1